MTAQTNKENAFWRKKYIKILQSGPDESEYLLAAELINQGYANGKISVNRTGSGSPINNVVWKGPTTAGREYMDELELKIKKETFRYKAFTFLSHMTTALLTSLLTYLVKLFTC